MIFTCLSEARGTNDEYEKVPYSIGENGWNSPRGSPGAEKVPWKLSLAVTSKLGHRISNIVDLILSMMSPFLVS